MLQVAWHTFAYLWCNASVAAAHGTWEDMLNLGALVRGTGKQEKQFQPFLSAVPLMYTTHHALPYLKHKQYMGDRTFGTALTHTGGPG